MVADQYRLFGGKSPINEINRGIIERLASAFQNHGIDLPIYFGNRNFEPYVSDALAQMKADGRKRAIAFVTSAFGSFSGCKQYKLDVETAQSQVGPDAPEVVKIRHYYSHPGFIEPLIENSVTALDRKASKVKLTRPYLTAFWTLPTLMQEVQTFIFLVDEPTMARTLWMFGFQRLFVRRCEWLIVMPKAGPLPQISHTDATLIHLLSRH